MEGIECALVFELVSLVKDDDVRWAVVLPEALEEFVPGGGLAVDVESLAEAL